MDDLENSDDIEEVTGLRAMINDAAVGGITDTPEQISTPSDDEDVESKVANVDEAVGEVDEAQEVEPIQPIEPPTSWRADKKEAFKKLPPDIQEYVVQRESERDAYLNQKGQKYSELDKVLAEREEEWSRHGQSSAKVVSQLLAWDKYLQDRPIDAIQELAAKAGEHDAILVIDVESGDREKYTFDLNAIYSVDWIFLHQQLPIYQPILLEHLQCMMLH